MTIDDTLIAAMREWRRDFHAHPEFGFTESRTAARIAALLRGFGFDAVTEGVGGTGVVATLRRGSSNRAIALRADMDALRIGEQMDHAYRSRHEGLMHACGHDGHVSMLLGAAHHLAAEGGFDGTVHFLFQPAEEWGQGALAMLSDGLLERFPFDEIYGLHILPGLPVGHFETMAGPIMSAEDIFDIRLQGVGGHAARPHHTQEAMLAACALVVNLQSIVARRLSPTDTAVVSVTEILTDGTRNALPGMARVLGDARSFRPEVSAAIEAEMRRIAEGTALTHRVAAEVTYERVFVPLINDAGLTEDVLAAATAVAGPSAVRVATAPMTASEDFARFLAHVPGVFTFIGNGEASAPLHNPSFDFNDDALGAGAGFFAAIARRRLPLTHA